MLFLFVWTPIYLRILFYLATKLWFLWRNKRGNVHYWKNQENTQWKTVSRFSLKPLKRAHDTIQWLKNVVHYLNMKMKEN